MAKGHKPKAGSRAYWPRKRAGRVYSKFKHSKELERIKKAEETKPLEFAGYKAGMTQAVFTDIRKGIVTQGQDLAKGVSVIECPPLFVFGIKLYRKGINGFETSGVIWTKDLKKDILRKLGIPKKKKEIPDIEGRLENVSDIRLLVHTQPRESGMRKKKPEVFEIDLSGTLENKWNYAKEKLGKDIGISEV
ncbi:MAG: 50S ribosomal protein L3, partial [Candidatus Aenigmatarchaeota archaeon]